jgi:hypothetical protein
LEELDRAAQDLNVSRQAVIKTLVRQALDQHSIIVCCRGIACSYFIQGPLRGGMSSADVFALSRIGGQVKRLAITCWVSRRPSNRRGRIVCRRAGARALA